MKLNNKKKKEFYQNLIDACKTGNIQFINEVINSDNVKQINDPVPGKMLIQACGYGNIDIIKELYNSPILEKHLNHYDNLKLSFVKACKYGHLDISNFILKKLDAINRYTEGIILDGMINAVENGNLNIVEHYIKNPSIMVNQEKLINKILDFSCIYNQTNIAKYVIEETNFQNNEKFSKTIDSLFFTSLKNESFDVLRYFIFDLNISKTPFMDSAIFMVNNNGSSNVNNWFKIRELGQTLEEELNKTDVNLTNKKLKL